MPDSVDAAQAALWAKFREFVNEHNFCVQERDEHQRLAAQAEDRRLYFYDEIQKFQSVGLQLGFDLLQLLYSEGSPNSESFASDPDTSNSQVSIKDFVLTQLRNAYPKPLLASEIRESLEKSGQKVHEKTVGMTLYRWSQKGNVTRDGRLWKYAPTDLEQVNDHSLSSEELDD